jgi:hypothetical protein
MAISKTNREANLDEANLDEEKQGKSKPGGHCIG